MQFPRVCPRLGQISQLVNTFHLFNNQSLYITAVARLPRLANGHEVKRESVKEFNSLNNFRKQELRIKKRGRQAESQVVELPANFYQSPWVILTSWIEGNRGSAIISRGNYIHGPWSICMQLGHNHGPRAISMLIGP